MKPPSEQHIDKAERVVSSSPQATYLFHGPLPVILKIESEDF
jgi:hypothetical protein